MNKKVFLAVMLGLLSSRGVFAEETAPSYMMDEVVVSATKTENARKDVSNSMIVIDSETLEKSPAQSLGELLANKAGIDLATTGNYGGATQEIDIRGMSADGTQVFINGVNVNSISLGSADVSKIPLANIERIEIVKGAGSMLYGSGASGGVINIYTKDPSAEGFSLAATLEGGSESTYGMRLSQGMPIADNLGYLLTLGKHGTDGFRDNSDLREYDGSLNVMYKDGDDLKVTLYGDYTNRKFGQPSGDPPSGTTVTQYISENAGSLLSHHEDDDAHLVLNIERKISDSIRLGIKPVYTYSKSYNYLLSPITNEKSWVMNEVSGYEGVVNMTPLDGAEILLGSDYKQYDNENRQLPMDAAGNDLSTSESVAKHDYHTQAIYADLQYRPSHFFKVIGGLRQEDNSVFGVENVYRYGLVLNPTEKTAIKFNRGSHFKAPTMNDLFWPDTGNVKGNAALSPETGWHTDLTVEQLIGNNVFLTAGYFNWTVKNKIDWAEDAAQPSYVYDGTQYYYWVPTNLNEYEADGMELSADIKLQNNLKVSLDYTLTYAKEEKVGRAVRQATYTPKEQFRGMLTYETSEGLTVAPSFSYTSKRPYYGTSLTDEPDEILSSYWVMDLKVSKRLDDHFVAFFTVNNLLDEQYVTRLDPSRYPYPGTERSFLLGLTYSY